ncbi:MAG: hypothetical protein LBL09_04280 [Oscillospiraceae bacterium]|jgi:acetyl-CoA carboxylase biotin carboxyl carrier protein|nr:hypothetical protein [Oscillospiraceae bacterium]
MDIASIEKLIAALERSSLAYLEYQDSSIRLCLKKGGSGLEVQPPLPASLAASAKEPERLKADGGVSAGTQAQDENIITVVSPIVGSVYRSREPGQEPLVSAGKKVLAGDVLGLIEAMKMFNEIKAPCAGTVSDILFEDGDLAEFGAVLFKIHKD